MEVKELAQHATFPVDEAGQEEGGILIGRILAVIRRHPEGVPITEIGNELGVDWRSLTAALLSLVKERKIEKIDTMYYLGEFVREERL